jgi:hypothetical protein
MTKVGAAQKSANRRRLDQLLRHSANSADYIIKLFGTLCRVDKSSSYHRESIHGGLPLSIVNEPWRLAPWRIGSLVPQELRAA